MVRRHLQGLDIMSSKKKNKQSAVGVLNRHTCTIKTGGDGIWSSRKTNVRCIGLDLAYLDEDKTFGELQVRFDRASWNTTTDSLIYTDKTFLKGLQDELIRLGLSADVNYSEAGMQGDDYVSLDVGLPFIQSWFNKCQLTN